MREMRGLRRTAIFLVTSAAVGFASPPFFPKGQHAPSSDSFADRAQQAPAASATSETVKIFVSVRDKQGRAVRDLSPQDLQVLEDGQPQRIEAISWPALALGLVFDTSNSRRGQPQEAVRESAEALLAEFVHAQNTALVVAFNNVPEVLAPPTNDLGTLRTAVKRGTENFGGGTALYDTLQFIATTLRADEFTAKVLFISSDCQDNLSRVDLPRTIEIVQRTKTRLYVVTTEILPSFPGMRGRLSEAATRLAAESGGRAFLAGTPDQIRRAFAGISEELRGLCLVQFRPTNATRDGKFRRIKVRTVGKGFRVSAPAGYFAPRN
jgi:Ca-activated chloride channel family protein